MPPRKLWFRASTNSWMICILGKRIPLAKGKESRAEAEAAFCRLMVERGQITTKPSELKIAVLCDLFLDHSERHCAADTYAWHKNHLNQFCQVHGRLACRDMKRFHLSRGLDSHKTWTGARRSAQVIGKRIFSWGRASETNPAVQRACANSGRTITLTPLVKTVYRKSVRWQN